MYALIYDEHDLTKPKKEVISAHYSRATAEKALAKRQKALGRRVWECHTRIVWIDGKVTAGAWVHPGEFNTWRPGEKIPEGELYSDTD
ncbi:MAG: hypothetical protein JSW39_16475 [Desulfobacterales bacterium]|nr:MAG: hypothetical protein JSW39_16475 [Desulfobacterales bacterium]